MKRIQAIVLLVVTLAAAAAARAQGKPDFSGTWKMDATRSASAVQNEPIGPVTVVIVQSPTEFTITTMHGQQIVTNTIKLDGTESKVTGGTAKARWDNDTLVVESIREIQGASVTTKESRSLDARGNEMHVDSVLEVQHGYTLKGTKNYGAGTDVYVRVRP